LGIFLLSCFCPLKNLGGLEFSDRKFLLTLHQRFCVGNLCCNVFLTLIARDRLSILSWWRRRWQSTFGEKRWPQGNASNTIYFFIRYCYSSKFQSLDTFEYLFPKIQRDTYQYRKTCEDEKGRDKEIIVLSKSRLKNLQNNQPLMNSWFGRNQHWFCCISFYQARIP